MRQFLKQTFASIIGTVLGLSIFFSLGAGFILSLVIVLASQQAASVKDKSILVFNLSTIVQDGYSGKSLDQILSSEEKQNLMLRQIIEGIKEASNDIHIKGIFLDGRNTSNLNGYANLAEIRAALAEFKAKGKKIIAYANDWSEKNYFLASIADQIMINPRGSLEINGLVSEPMFLASALLKYGIGVQVVRVGSYKSAVEPFTRSNLSPENKQQLQKLLEDIWQNFLNNVVKSRQIDVNHLKEITDNEGILSAKQAKSEKLVDQIAHYDQVLTQLKTLSGANELNDLSTINLENYLEITVDRNKKKEDNKIAILYAEGTITDGQGNVDEIGGDKFAKEIRNIREDEEIKAVVLRINSPGGSATASDIILREVELLQEKKPVIISMGNVAASGGYLMATGGQYIFAENQTVTGSIGVFGMLFNLQKIANNNGITWDVVKTGKLADIGTSTRPKTEQEIKIYQKEVDKIYDLFLEKVSTSRHLSKERVNQLAQGRVWSGQEAEKIGLVDQIGGLESAIKYTAQVAKLGENWQIEEYPEQRSWKTIFLDRISKTQQKNISNDPLTKKWKTITKEWQFVKTLNDPKGLYLIFPYNLKID